MVSPKKSAQDKNWLNNMLDEAKKELEKNTLGFRWVVVEHTPAYNTGGYYDQDIDAKNVTVSPYFDSMQEANDWKERHSPDPGNSLIIRRQRLVRREYKEWVDY